MTPPTDPAPEKPPTQRIEAALVRIEAATTALVESDTRHRMLRARTQAALADLDAILGQMEAR